MKEEMKGFEYILGKGSLRAQGWKRDLGRYSMLRCGWGGGKVLGGGRGLLSQETEEQKPKTEEGRQ